MLRSFSRASSEKNDLEAQLRALMLFDERDYLAANPDIGDAVERGLFRDGFAHFRAHGLREGRFPGYHGFNWDDYVRANADLAHFRKDPDPERAAKEHFRTAGYGEGRRLKP